MAHALLAMPITDFQGGGYFYSTHFWWGVRLDFCQNGLRGTKQATDLCFLFIPCAFAIGG
jgi:hypothetical protein